MFSKPLRPSCLFTLLFAGAAALMLSCHEPDSPRVLVFFKTNGWKHTSIPYGNEAIQQLGHDNGFLVDTTKDATFFNDDNLRRYDAVVFNSTTRNVLNAEQQAAFERFIQAGGGFVGIHAAADTEYEWPWYDQLVGAHFSSHPNNPNVRKATVEVTDKTHISTQGLPDRWERTDEWYNYRSFYPDIHILAYLDENSYEGGTNGSNHPIAWYHDFDGGRAFYTGGGHEDSSFSEPLFLGHLLGGIKYAMGSGVLDYSKAYAVTVPEENRFAKTVLVNDLDTPMELAITGDGRIFYTELRSANLSVYDTRTGKNSLVHQFNVATTGGTGLIGVALDPDFGTNRFIYLYYSPPTDEEPILFNLSRFTIGDGNTLDLSSEKVLLQVPVQENSGAHHGGSLAWDKDGNLFLSTGDSSSPFPSEGYAPLDERPGKEYYQRSAANTNDLKGKILRIHPEPDGSYTIPEGNLFPQGTAKTRPEIYIMGCRNPYRIAVNPGTSTLYWGEIGPDAGKDSVQGPMGYDEFNQAKTAGNYGWPYFVGNNQAYVKWDFATNTAAGPHFNPQEPVNNSPNNTGLNQLPPATPAMIWYPYAASKEFPELGLGGRSAMAGSFYTFDGNSTSQYKFPAYYDGALFVFDWMRNWVLALRFDEDENYKSNEAFMMANGDFRRPIDLVFGKDGVMYMLEYGSVYGADNDDARLVKIEYNTGNRAPIAKAGIVDSAAMAAIDKRVFLTSEKRLPPRKIAAGESPLRVLFTGRGSNDPDDDDSMTYAWYFDGKNVGSTKPNPAYTYTIDGTYHAILKVTDKSGLTGTDTVLIEVGNAMPEVNIISLHNKSFFWGNESFPFDVHVVDKEDGAIDPARVKANFRYVAEPGSGIGEGATESSGTVPLGYTLIANSDCKACHTMEKVSVGPAYREIATRYKKQPGAVSILAKKIIAGGGGNWGKEHVMAAHPQISEQDANEIIRYILTLANGQDEGIALSNRGTLALTKYRENEPRGVYVLSASYTDNGANGIGPLTSRDVIVLRQAKVKTVYADEHVGFRRYGNSLSGGSHKAFILLKNIDLTGIRKFTYEYASQNRDGEIDLRLDSQAGPVISSTPYKATGSWDKAAIIQSETIEPLSGKHNLYFVVVKRNKPNDDIINLKSIQFDK